MKKTEFETLLMHFIDVVDGTYDPYEEMDMRLMRIRDLSARALDLPETLAVWDFPAPIASKKKTPGKKQRLHKSQRQRKLKGARRNT